jgi:CheY-like chemotaxis protein
VLVAEDDDAVRESVTRSLRDLGYSVYEAADGPSALEIVKAEPHIDLLLMDYRG